MDVDRDLDQCYVKVFTIYRLLFLNELQCIDKGTIQPRTDAALSLVHTNRLRLRLCQTSQMGSMV